MHVEFPRIKSWVQNSIMGTENLIVLLQALCEYLEDCGIVSLAQGCKLSLGANSYWLTVEDLELEGDWRLM